jgi:predicted porin
MTNHTNPAELLDTVERIRHTLTAIILIAMLWHPGRANAGTDGADTRMFSFSGFGTLGVVHSSEERADFAGSPLDANGAGHTREWSPDVDSRIGAQVNANLTPRISAVLQVISEQNFDNTYSPRVEWANIKYQFTPYASVRVGRIVLPIFILSDTRKVGYAIPRVRPPVEVYSLVPLTDSDGADASYRLHVGDFVNTLVGTYGKTSFGLPGGSSAEAKRSWVIADTLEYGSATLHIAYLESTVDLNVNALDALFNALRQFGPQGTALADKYHVDKKLAQLITVGGMYDPGSWFVRGEWARRNLHSALGESTAWYAIGGYRLAKFTPSLTYAQVKANSNTSDPGLTVSALPPFLAGPAAGLNAGLNSLLGSIAVQNTITASTRWDFMKDVDLKLQYDHTRLGAGSAGTLINLQPGFRPGGTVNLFSVAIDFVW